MNATLEAPSRKYPTEGDNLREFTLPTACGRSVLLRHCSGDAAIQIGIIGKRGGMVEAVSFDATQLPGLIGYLDQMSEELRTKDAELDVAAKDSLLDRLSEAEAKAKATHCEAGHPLTPSNSFRKGNGKGCRTCRREGNHYWQRGLA